MTRFPALFLALVWGADLAAQTLNMPSNARLRREVQSPIDSFAMPIGPWADGAVQTITAEGNQSRQAWQISAAGLTTLQLIRPLRDQLRNAGFDVLFECQDQACGGFDFRFAIPVFPPPEMRVNLGDYRYLAAQNDGAIVSILVSRTTDAGFVQVTQIGGEQVQPSTTDAPLRGQDPATAATDLGGTLMQTGRVVLSDLAFETGSSQLGEGPFQSLQDLADFLAASPDLRIALVGHTDASGSLNGNITLSKRRAGSVRERLVASYNVDRAQLDAQGIGYLAPIAPNLTPEGRTANRRVEAIITTTR